MSYPNSPPTHIQLAHIVIGTLAQSKWRICSLMLHFNFNLIFKFKTFNLFWKQNSIIFVSVATHINFVHSDFSNSLLFNFHWDHIIWGATSTHKFAQKSVRGERQGQKKIFLWNFSVSRFRISFFNFFFFEKKFWGNLPQAYNQNIGQNVDIR